MDRGEDETAAGSHWLVRAYYTPVGDALRGQLSGRLDVRREISAARLPASLASLVHDVVRRTRLWRREKLDVARELTAHFADGLAAGRTAEDLARDFGNPARAAGLIRKAKRRNRPLTWHIWHTSTRLMLAALVVGVVAYAWLTARFYLGQPLIARNYWHEINAARRMPDGDRAWPLYREALIKLNQQGLGWVDIDRVALGPSGKHWTKAVAQLERHKDVIELVRQAAKKPRFGFYLGDKADIEAARAAGAGWLASDKMPLADENRDLISAHVEGPQQSRIIARLLGMDARVAAVAGDGARVTDDMTAMIGLADQLFEPRATLVEQLVGIAIFGVAIDTIERIIDNTPAVFSDDQLRVLAHRIAGFRGGNMSIDFTGEGNMFDDIVQRAFTDDGRGDGRITPEGMTLLVDYSSGASQILKLCNPTAQGDRQTVVMSRLISPGAAALVGSRQENSQLYHELLAQMIAAHQGDPWRWDLQAIEDNERRTKEAAGGTNRLRYSFVGLMLPALGAVVNAGERSVQTRDAAEVVIALELWRRRHGDWPARLEQLVPDLLPSVPPDRIDGQPLRYVVRNGKPILYTIGNDRRDDGGQANVENPQDAYPIGFGPVAPDRKPADGSRGDWIFFPPAPEEIEEEVEPPGTTTDGETIEETGE